MERINGLYSNYLTNEELAGALKESIEEIGGATATVVNHLYNSKIILTYGIKSGWSFMSNTMKKRMSLRELIRSSERVFCKEVNECCIEITIEKSELYPVESN